MRSQRFLDRPPTTWLPFRILAMLLLSVGFLLAGQVSTALADSPVVQADVASYITDAAIDDSAEDAETFDGSAHDVQLADTGAQRSLLLTLGGLLSIGGGLTAWWVSHRSKSIH